MYIVDRCYLFYKIFLKFKVIILYSKYIFHIFHILYIMFLVYYTYWTLPTTVLPNNFYILIFCLLSVDSVVCIFLNFHLFYDINVPTNIVCILQSQSVLNTYSIFTAVQLIQFSFTYQILNMNI